MIDEADGISCRAARLNTDVIRAHKTGMHEAARAGEAKTSVRAISERLERGMGWPVGSETKVARQDSEGGGNRACMIQRNPFVLFNVKHPITRGSATSPSQRDFYSFDHEKS